MTSGRRLVALLAGAFIVLVAPLVPLAAPAPAAADTGDFEFESFDARYELGAGADGVSVATVTETIVAVFPAFDQNRGIVRAIPLRHLDIPLELRVDSVTDAAGAPVPYERDDVDGFAELALGTDDYVHGRTTYVIEYRIRGPIRDFGETQEFYWDVNGDGWAQAFGRVTASVELGDGLRQNALRADCYQGGYGDGTACDELTEAADGRGFSFAANALGPYQTLTIDVAFPPGTVGVPQDPRDHWLLTVVPPVVGWTALGLLAVAILARLLVWRAPRPRRAIVAQFEPPDGDLRVQAEVIGRRKRLIPASLLRSALLGAVRVVDTAVDDPRVQAKDRFAVEIVAATKAEGFDRQVIDALAESRPEPGRILHPARTGAAVGAQLYALQATAPSEAGRLGYTRRGRSEWTAWLIWPAWLLLGALVPSWVWAVWTDLDPPLGTTIVVIVLGVITTSVLQPPRVLTGKGADLRDHLRGLRRYLTVAEEERIRVLQSPEGAERTAQAPAALPDGAAILKLYERLLPYAVLWGVEAQWQRVLGDRYEAERVAPSPEVTLGFGALHAFSAASMSGVRAPVSSSSGSSWSGSGGGSSFSGSGGGGFSGGGGGGGGGGGR
ncbi:MAG: DUF2207 domain-containing protein [Microbacteriaceae bacterium]|nr:DUF2207 domain-containing protein [Microbacteriaceae bacterium]